MNTSINKPYTEQHCRDYASDESALNLSEIEQRRRHTPHWQYVATENQLVRTYRFADYKETIAFVNLVARVAEAENHHPEMVVGYNRCKVSYYTHTVNGLTDNDFICAAKIDQQSGK